MSVICKCKWLADKLKIAKHRIWLTAYQKKTLNNSGIYNYVMTIKNIYTLDGPEQSTKSIRNR